MAFGDAASSLSAKRSALAVILHDPQTTGLFVPVTCVLAALRGCRAEVRDSSATASASLTAPCTGSCSVLLGGQVEGLGQVKSRKAVRALTFDQLPSVPQITNIGATPDPIGRPGSKSSTHQNMPTFLAAAEPASRSL